MNRNTLKSIARRAVRRVFANKLYQASKGVVLSDKMKKDLADELDAFAWAINEAYESYKQDEDVDVFLDAIAEYLWAMKNDLPRETDWISEEYFVGDKFQYSKLSSRIQSVAEKINLAIEREDGDDIVDQYVQLGIEIKKYADIL